MGWLLTIAYEMEVQTESTQTNEGNPLLLEIRMHKQKTPYTFQRYQLGFYHIWGNKLLTKIVSNSEEYMHCHER